MKYDIGLFEYVLVGIGILLLPAFGLGLIILGFAVYRIGQKMELYKQQKEEELDRKYDIKYVREEELDSLR